MGSRSFQVGGGGGRVSSADLPTEQPPEIVELLTGGGRDHWDSTKSIPSTPASGRVVLASSGSWLETQDPGLQSRPAESESALEQNLHGDSCAEQSMSSKSLAGFRSLKSQPVAPFLDV